MAPSAAEIAYTAQTQGWSQDRLTEELSKVQTPAPPADAPPVEGSTPPVNTDAPPADNPPADDKPAFEIPTDIQEKLTRLEQIEKELPGLSEYKQKWESHQDIISVIPELEDPFASDEDRIVNAIKKTSAIKDHSIATKIATANREELVKNPIEAIAIQQAIEDPDMANSVKLDKMKKMVYAELGIDPDQNPEEWDEIVKLKVEAKAFKAIKAIEEKKNEFSSKPNLLLSLTQERQKRLQEQGRRTEEWQKAVPELQLKVKEIAESIEIDGKTIKSSVALSPEIVSKTIESMWGVIQNMEPSEEGRQQAVQYVTQALRLAAIPDLIRSAVLEDRKVFQAEERERIINERNNKGPVIRQEKPGADGKVKSPAELAYESMNKR